MQMNHGTQLSLQMVSRNRAAGRYLDPPPNAWSLFCPIQWLGYLRRRMVLNAETSKTHCLLPHWALHFNQETHPWFGALLCLACSHTRATPSHSRHA